MTWKSALTSVTQCKARASCMRWFSTKPGDEVTSVFTREVFSSLSEEGMCTSEKWSNLGHVGAFLKVCLTPRSSALEAPPTSPRAEEMRQAVLQFQCSNDANTNAKSTPRPLKCHSLGAQSARDNIEHFNIVYLVTQIWSSVMEILHVEPCKCRRIYFFHKQASDLSYLS